MMQSRKFAAMDSNDPEIKRTEKTEVRSEAVEEPATDRMTKYTMKYQTKLLADFKREEAVLLAQLDDIRIAIAAITLGIDHIANAKGIMVTAAEVNPQ